MNEETKLTDSQSTLSDLMHLVRSFEEERDWEQFHTPKNLAMGVAVETGELLEHFLWTTPEESQQIKDDPEQLHQVGEEIADVFAYLLSLSNCLGIDLSDTFYRKMQRNMEKYPADKYRGKYKL